MMGIHANTVIPHGDTIAGLKYIGRRFVADCFAGREAEARAASRRGSRMQLSSPARPPA